MSVPFLQAKLPTNTKRLGVALFILVLFLSVVFLSFFNRIKQNKLASSSPHDAPTAITYTTEGNDEVYKDEILRFAVVADTHIGQSIHGLDGGNNKRLQQAIEVSKEHGAEFFVALGDLTQTGSKKELGEVKRVLEDGGMPYFTAIGNHDVFQNPDYYDESFGPKFKEVSYKLTKAPTTSYGPINPEAKLFFFDMTKMESEYGDILGADQAAWLKEKLPENMQNANTIILAFSGQGLQPLNNDQEDQLALFLCESHIVAYIHGGPHKFQTKEESCYFDWMYKRDNRISTIQTISPGTIGEYSPERSAQVVIIHVFPDFRYELERIPIGYNPIYPDYWIIK